MFECYQCGDYYLCQERFNSSGIPGFICSFSKVSKHSKNCYMWKHDVPFPSNFELKTKTNKTHIMKEIHPVFNYVTFTFHTFLKRAQIIIQKKFW